ncbi:MAG: HEAT repeat domain-containing protein [Planctomycetota bacterium]
MGETQEARETKRRGLLGRLAFGRGKWYWMLLRLAVVVGLIVAFRWRVLAWVTLGHNAVWKAATGAQENHQGDVGFLLRLREPGVAALLGIGEGPALAQAQDPAMAPALAQVVATHGEAGVRRAALEGLNRCSAARAASAAAEALDDPHSSVRAFAAQVLADQNARDHVSALRSAREREADPDARSALDRAIQTLTSDRPAPDAPPPPDRVRTH